MTLCKKVCQVVFISFLIIFSLYGCQTKVEKKNFTLAQGMGVLNATIFVTNEKNFWADSDIGLKAEVRPFLAGRLALDALLAGDVDVVTVGDTPFMYGYLKHPEMRIIATVMESRKDEKILVRRDSGIQNISDLSGKKLAAFMGTASEYYAYKLLTSKNISLDKVKMINLQPPDMVSAIVRGDIDAYVMWEPHIQNGKNKLGDNFIILKDENQYLETWNIVVLEKFIKNDPDKVKRILKAVIRGADYLNKNRDESIAITAKQLGLDAAVLKSIWGDYTFKVKLDKSLVQTLEEQSKWVKDSGKMDKQANIPDFHSAVYSRALEELNPQAVTMQ